MFFNFPVFKNTIKRKAFENAYESSIIFQPFLYANVPVESPSYASTFCKNKEENLYKISVSNVYLIYTPSKWQKYRNI